MDFEAQWQKYEDRKTKNSRKKKRFRKRLVVGFSLIILVSLVAFAADRLWLRDKVDFPYVPDEALVGTWETVDFVQHVEDFSPDKRSWNPPAENPFAFNQLAFTSSGACLVSVESRPLSFIGKVRYTKGHILDFVEETDSAYVIKQYPQGTYMMFQWKSGDYSFRRMTPWYYVLRQVDGVDRQGEVPVQSRGDNTEVPFVNDPAVVGKWRVVSYGDSAVDFGKPDPDFTGVITLSEVEFKATGEIICTRVENPGDGDGYSGGYFKWTAGSIIDLLHPIIEDYYIEEREGKTYLLFPWIDYKVIYNGHGPNYYVLEKIE